MCFYRLESKKRFKIQMLSMSLYVFIILVLLLLVFVFNKQSTAQVNQNRDFLRIGHFTISFKLN